MGNCRKCKYYYPAIDRTEKKSYCRRFPKQVKVEAYYWCGEFVELRSRKL